MAGKGNWEGWAVHNKRITAEKARAVAEHLCPEVVNDEWAHGYTGRKVCLKTPSPDALQLGLEFCGTHLRGHLKMEREASERAAARAQAKKDNERYERTQKIKNEQEEAIIVLLVKHGLAHAELTRPWHYRTKDLGWTVTVPLSVVWKLIDELPMLDPDEAVKVFEERERAAAEAAKPKGQDAPF